VVVVVAATTGRVVSANNPVNKSPAINDFFITHSLYTAVDASIAGVDGKKPD
jgi:hypothetical protein